MHTFDINNEQSKRRHIDNKETTITNSTILHSLNFYYNEIHAYRIAF